ncbi:MAG TPA: bacteriocin [Candidatus Poseidoniales archaeon]|nr:MAG TPA: bacteriocin [Candidatus Poseidoniales archaeon]
MTEAYRCIICTNVERVYDSDPQTNPKAQSFDTLTHKELQNIVGPAEHDAAGPSGVVDPMGVADAARANLTLNVLDGRNPELIRAAIEGGSFPGTVIESEEE